MNDTINPASSSQPKTSVATVLSNTNSSQDGPNAEGVSSASANENSFQDSIERAFDDSQQENERSETEQGGNDLPVSNDLADSSADDDRLLSMVDFNIQAQFSDQMSAQDKPKTQETIAHTQSVPLDIEINVADELNVLSSQTLQPAKIEVNAADKLNVLSSQVPQHLKIDTNVKTKNAQRIAGNTTATINTIEKSVIQQAEISQLNLDQMALSDQKTQVLMTAMQQQKMLSNSQISQLSQTVSAQAEADIDSLPLLLNPSMNSFSATNLQSLPQAEIVETFARPAWSQGMGKQILLMVNQNISSAEIRLNPAHLGPIEVLIDMSEDQVNVSLSSRHAIVREAMEQALPKLREMLDANGFNLADTDISQHSFAQQREQNTENNNTALTGDSADQSVSSEISEHATKHLSASTAMVDYYI